MLTFLLYTLFFWVGTAAFARVMHQSIQAGEWLDSLLGWQAMLDKLFQSDKKWKKSLAKPLGDCAFCFSHAITFICFWFYVLFAHAVLHFWVTTPVHNLFLKVIINIVWYLLFGSIGTILSTLMLTLFKSSKNNDNK